MYEKHELEIIKYEQNSFVVASGENLDDGDVEGPDLPIEFS